MDAVGGGGDPVVGGGAGGGGGGGGSITVVPPRYDGGARIEADAFCEAWTQAYCARERTCEFLDVAQAPTCLARVRAVCGAWFARLDAGVYGYEPAQGTACVDATGNRSCNQGRGFSTNALVFDLASGPEACEALLVGVGVAGTPCEAAPDCAPGFTCAGGATSCRSCSPLPRVGEACDATTAPCHRAFCPPGDGGSACVAWLGAGAPCTASGQCDPEATRGCAPVGNDAGVRTCLAREPDGAPCMADEACIASYCNNGHRTDAGVRRCGFLALGQPCAVAGDCGPAAFCDGLGERSLGACAPRLALGAPCRPQRTADAFDGCTERGACLDGVCKRPRNDQLTGQQCRDALTDCVRGAYCPPLPGDGGYATCVVQGEVGARCSASAQCAPGLRCTNNTCERLGSAGERCFAQQQCKGLLTCPLLGAGPFACTPLASPGASCTVSGVVCGAGEALGLEGACLRDGGCAAPLPLDADCGANAECASGRCLLGDGGLVLPPARGTCAEPCLP